MTLVRCEFPHRLLGILWHLLQSYYTTSSFYASKYLSYSKTQDVKLKSCSAKFPPLWWSICAGQLDPCKTEETIFQRLAGLWRCGVSALLRHKAKSFRGQTAFDVMLTESFSGELGGDSECPWKKRKLFWWLSFGTCVTGLLFSDVWRWMHVHALLCVSLQSRSDKNEKKRRSKKHSTETWSGTKSHRSSSASRIPEPCRRHENSGSIQREPFLPWHQVCTGI